MKRRRISLSYVPGKGCDLDLLVRGVPKGASVNSHLTDLAVLGALAQAVGYAAVRGPDGAWMLATTTPVVRAEMPGTLTLGSAAGAMVKTHPHLPTAPEARPEHSVEVVAARGDGRQEAQSAPADVARSPGKAVEPPAVVRDERTAVKGGGSQSTAPHGKASAETGAQNRESGSAAPGMAKGNASKDTLPNQPERSGEGAVSAHAKAEVTKPVTVKNPTPGASSASQQGSDAPEANNDGDRIDQSVADGIFSRLFEEFQPA